jgi:hypothetical protein
MTRKLYTLVLLLPNLDAQPEFEPSALWRATGEGWEVRQQVYKDGGVLYGTTDHYWERLSDVVGDTDRFVSLTLNRE